MSYARVPEDETGSTQVPMMPMGSVPMQVPMMPPPPVMMPQPLIIPPDPTPAEFEHRIKERRVAFQMDAYFKDAWQLVKTNFCIFFAGILVWLAIFVGVLVGIFALRIHLFGRRSLEDAMDGREATHFGWKVFVYDLVAQWLLVMFLAYPGLFSAFTAVFNAMRTNGQVQFKHFFSGYSRVWDCMKFSTVYLFLSTILFMAFWVPGILFGFFTFFALPMYIDHPDMTIWQSYKFSKRVVANYACSVLGFIVVSILILLLGALFFGVGLFLAAPLVLVAKCFCYHHLAGVKGCPLSPGLVMVAPAMPQYAFAAPVAHLPQAPQSGAPVTYVPVNAPVYPSSQV